MREPARRPMRLSTLLWIAAAQGIGGVSPALTKLALAGFSPFTLVVARQLLGTLVLLVMASRMERGRGPHRPWSRRDVGLLVTLSWAGFALPQVLNSLGLDRSTATHGALLSPLEPIGILIGGAWLLGERLTAARALAVALGAIGAALIVAPGMTVGEADASGDLLIAAGHLCWAIYTLAAKPLLARHGPMRVTLWAAALSWIPLAPFALSEPLDPARALPALGWVVTLAVLATAGGAYTWSRALRDVSTGTMAAFIFVQPVVGLVVGLLFLGEAVGPLSLLGAFLILLGVTWVALRGELSGAGAEVAP